uniref:Cardiomyopathy associated 5 n=1 Tax=Monopterus albus TaxID=43700 RepID=A0A3Q3JFA9_MONAL
ITKMEESERLDSEPTELQELQGGASESMSQDDEDELEELQNSLREIVQDQSVKPKVQCLMVDPSFSMVTVQSEDSGIVWETASSRCSTPWASETSSVSEACSMEGPGAAGNITIVFDEEKIVRRRTRSGGRSSRLGDRLSRPGSSRSASALGVERAEMAEVSLPNVKQEKTETEPNLKELKSKDQQLFSLISEGYEILNIRVPSKLPTVDEEENTELQDNLSYLDQTPKIRSRNHSEWIRQQNQVLSAEGEILDMNTSDVDYFEKFTLLDETVPGEQASMLQEEAEQPAVKPQAEEQTPTKEIVKDSPSAPEDSFVLVADVDIVGEHLDEVFYGEGAATDALQGREDGEARIRTRRESQRSMKESGSVLFGSEETTLTPIYISPGPPKIIDPILLEEPTAMSFMYSDLYEDAVGERRKSDEEYSEAESVTSEKSYERCLSDSEEAEGYLEKFILKDETPTVEVQPESMEHEREGRMMWSQSKFETTGCLTRVRKEEDEDMKKTDAPKEGSGGSRSEDLQSASIKKKGDIVTGKGGEEIQLFTITEKQPVKEALEESIQDSKLRKDQMEDWEAEREMKRDQTEPPESSTNEPLSETQAEKTEEGGKHQREEERITEIQQSNQTQKVVEINGEVLVKATEEKERKAPVNSEVPVLDVKSKIQTETTDKKLSEETVTETKMVAAGEKITTVAKAEAPAEVKEPKEEMSTLTESSGESTETLQYKKKEAAEVILADVAPVEVITDCDCAVHAVVEVTEKVLSDKEIQTQVQIDLQERASAETSAPEGEKEREVKLPEFVSKTGQESQVKIEILPEEVKTNSEKKHHEVLDFKQHQQEESVTDSAAGKTKLITEVKSPTAGVGTADQDMTDVNDELILLVPKGQTVELSIDQWSGKITSDVALPEPEHLIAPEDSVAPSETLRALMEGTKTVPQLEVEPEITVMEAELLINHLDRKYSPAPVEEEQKMQRDLEEDKGIFSPLRSFTPQEDLSRLHREGMQFEEGDGEQRVLVEELDYVVISKQDAKDMPESGIQRDAEEPRPVSSQDRDIEVQMEGKVFDLQARLTAELQGMDWFCLTCGCLLSEDDCVSEEHCSHEVNNVDKAYEEIKKLGDWISELQGRSENIEDMVAELELAYNSVEVNHTHCEAAMHAQNEEMMALVMDQYNNMSISMEEEKKTKLEQLYDQIVSFQESIDSAKATLETTAREAETDARVKAKCCGCVRLKAALDSAMSLELGPRGLLVFEDYAKGNASSSHHAQRKGIPVPQRPTLQPQEPGSATSSSVTVYWKVNPGDIIDCFQIYCMEDPQGAVSEEYRMTVKESYCGLEELEPDKTYKVWVMAVNYTGCSLPSERLTFRTAPSVPVIDTERCSVMWDSAILRWTSAKQPLEHSYILEYCRQYEVEGEGLRSISGIKSCEQGVVLQPNENYLFYIKAVNDVGASEQSEAALISTKGTRFHLLNTSAHPALELSVDQTTLHYSQDTHDNTPFADKQCPSILGELLPARGRYYWETIVSRSAAYRLGVAYSTANRNRSLGEDTQTWCLQCVPTAFGCRYQLLHNEVQSTVFVTEMPERVGTLLDYQLGCLSFYNAQNGQLLGAFSQHFTQPCHPALALEMPGSLEVSMVPELPEFTKDS